MTRWPFHNVLLNVGGIQLWLASERAGRGAQGGKGFLLTCSREEEDVRASHGLDLRADYSLASKLEFSLLAPGPNPRLVQMEI